MGKAKEIVDSINGRRKVINNTNPVSQPQVVISGASQVQTKILEKMACAVKDMAAWTGGVPTSRMINTTWSIQWGGSLSADRTISLVWDESNPWADQYYGTDTTGTKGWYDVNVAGWTNLGIASRNANTLNVTSDTGADATVPAVTPTLAGLMRASDKNKLDAVEDDAQKNVQADWNESDISSDAYIKNKPTISDTWIIYSLADWTNVAATIWNRAIASTMTGADKTYETTQEIDPLTGNTTSQTFTGDVTFDWATVNSEDSTYNHTNDIVNNTGVTETNTSWTVNNVDETINNDSDTVINNTGTTINNTGTITNNEDVISNYDWDNVNNYVDGSTTTNNQDWTVNNNYDEDYIENNTYETGSVVNNTGEVINNNNNYTETNNNTNTVVNNNGWITNNTGVTNNYDENSVNNFGGDVYIGWDIYLGWDIITMDSEIYSPSTIVEVWPWLSWTNIGNVSVCDGVNTTIAGLNPSLLDHIQLVVGDTISWNDLTKWITGGNPAIYGSPSELWWVTLTPTQVNAADFGVVFKFGDSAWIKATGFNFVVPLTNTILGVKANVIFTSTANSVAVDCITLTIYHTDGSEFSANVEQTDEFTGNWTDDDFTLTYTYISWAKVYINWLRQKTTNYTVSGTTLHFVVVPLDEDEILIDYMH